MSTRTNSESMREIVYDSWADWFAARVKDHEDTGIAFAHFVAPNYLYLKHGPMPTPPWE